MLDFLNSPDVQEQLALFWELLPGDIWDTLYTTVLATLFAYVIGLPLGILLVTGEKEGVRPLPGWFMGVLNFVINILRSVPFLILMILAMITVNLGIFNLIPFPALDGGRLLFILIRKITGKAVSDELEGKIHLIGMAILFSLMIFITLKDFNMFILKN